MYQLFIFGITSATGMGVLCAQTAQSRQSLLTTKAGHLAKLLSVTSHFPAAAQLSLVN